MIPPVQPFTSNPPKEPFQDWSPFFNTFSTPVENDQKKEIIASMTNELSRMIQHHLKKMKEHYKKLREDIHK